MVTGAAAEATTTYSTVRFVYIYDVFLRVRVGLFDSDSF
jgi:hypothetical protein